MVANTPDKCGFACHELNAAPNDYYGLAKKLGVQMRIDVVRQATQKLMDTAADTATVPSQFRAAIYTFGTSCTALGAHQDRRADGQPVDREDPTPPRST